MAIAKATDPPAGSKRTPEAHAWVRRLAIETLATRFQADRDLVVIENAQGSKLDPSNDDGFGAKMGMDATKPIGADPFTYLKTYIPGEDSVDLDTVLSGDRPAIPALDEE